MSKQNDGRVLTVRLTIQDGELADWLWDSIKGETRHGILVTAMADGDHIPKYQGYLDVLEDAQTLLQQCLHARQCNAPYGQTEKYPTVSELKAVLELIQEEVDKS